MSDYRLESNGRYWRAVPLSGAGKIKSLGPKKAITKAEALKRCSQLNDDSPQGKVAIQGRPCITPPNTAAPTKKGNTRQALLIEKLRGRGWEPGNLAGWTREQVNTWATRLISARFKSDTLPLAFIICEIAASTRPDTVRGYMYATISNRGGWIPGIDDISPRGGNPLTPYDRVQYLLDALRKKRVIPFSWVIDRTRSTLKPSSWAGLEDFATVAAKVYRKDFWAQMPSYVCVIVEKDTVAGRFSPVTGKYDVALHGLHGACSTTFANEIGEQLAKIEKPIHVYYIGDHDPMGYAIENSIKEKIADFSGVYLDLEPNHWTRIAVLPDDFERFDIDPLAPKARDNTAPKFIERFGRRCAEVEAIPANALRERLEQAILKHVPLAKWERLQKIEAEERESFRQVMAKIRGDQGNDE